MYFRFRGYADSQYQTTYINGFRMNDPIRAVLTIQVWAA